MPAQALRLMLIPAHSLYIVTGTYCDCGTLRILMIALHSWDLIQTFNLCSYTLSHAIVMGLQTILQAINQSKKFSSDLKILS